MSLDQLSSEYKQSALLIRNRLSELRFQLKSETDPEKIFKLKRRIAALQPMLTQMNELSELTANYYERGYYRDERYSSNCFDQRWYNKSQAPFDSVEDSRERAYGNAADYIYSVLLTEKKYHADSKRKKSKQEHRMQKLAARREKSSPVHKVSDDLKK